MSSCFTDLLLYVQIVFFAGILLVYCVTLIRLKFDVWESLKIWLGWSDAPRTTLENALALGVLAVTVGAFGLLFWVC